MTDYNDGNWHGWNGGECPVPPETLVQCRIDDATHEFNGAEDAAKEWNWETDNNCRVIAFRVTKPCREPSEVWLVGYHAFDDKERAEKILGELRLGPDADKFGPEWEPRLFREVLE